jgi:hypothetical protein
VCLYYRKSDVGRYSLFKLKVAAKVRKIIIKSNFAHSKSFTTFTVKLNRLYMRFYSRLKSIIFLCLMSFSPEIRSQDALLDSLVGRLSALVENRPAELIYLQTSKGIYETGEDLWFKAYVLDAQTHYLSARSRTLYVQMVNASNGEAVWQEKYPVENGMAPGHVFVQDTLPEGDYLLEAFTHQSFYSDSAEMSAVRKVKIVQNINKSERHTSFVKDSSFRFDVFPEGGNLVAGIPGRFAFKATDGQGYPVDIRGVLYEDELPLTEFESSHAGMGTILFTPRQDKTYSIKLDSGASYPLPEIHSQGMAFRLLGQDSSNMEFVVSQQGKEPQVIYLTGQLRGTVYCVAKSVLRDSLKVRLPLDKFPAQGIAVITLYDEQLLPVAERLVYVHPEKKLYITAEMDKKYYVTRGEVNVKIRVTDEHHRPVVAGLGVSVHDPFYDSPGDPSDIMTHVYLSSQIRGRVYDPGYYFDEKNPDRHAALDLLLLTQGWRRYVWLPANLTPRGEAVVSDGITGHQTVRKRKQKDVVLPLVKVSDTGGATQFVEADSAGYFVIDAGSLSFLHPGYVYLKPMLPEKFNPKLSMDDPFGAIGRLMGGKPVFYPLSNPEAGKQKDDDRPPVVGRDVIQLDAVTVIGESRRPVRDKYMGRLDSLLQLELGPWECDHGWLENYLPGYTHHHGQDSPCFDPTKRHPPVIGKRYVLMKPTYYEHKGSPCWFTAEYRIITYDGPAYSDEELLRMNNLWRVKGYYGVREFYQPDEIDLSSFLPDVRNTLLWAPSVVTDANGEAAVTFHCSDLNVRFVGRIEGTDSAGLLGMSEFDFRVIKIPEM